jgi:hypothetical protein
MAAATMMRRGRGERDFAWRTPGCRVDGDELHHRALVFRQHGKCLTQAPGRAFRVDALLQTGDVVIVKQPLPGCALFRAQP